MDLAEWSANLANLTVRTVYLDRYLGVAFPVPDGC